MMSAAAGLTALGVSATGVAKMWFRFPDIPDLVTNRWFLAYVAVSFFIGAAVSYYFDSADSKIMDIISAGLRLVGGSLVFYSLCQIWELGSAAVLLLLLIALRPQTRATTVAPGKPSGVALLWRQRHVRTIAAWLDRWVSVSAWQPLICPPTPLQLAEQQYVGCSFLLLMFVNSLQEFQRL